MKNLKKVLALVLVVAMMMTFAVSASAATYKDADDISSEYAGAVEVLSALKVLNGTTAADGTTSINPKANVTRAEFAKMAAYILNSGKDAAGAYASIASTAFADVVTADWFAASVGYVYNAGIVSGKSATKFDPKGNITGVEAAKIMLGALGYSAEVEGYTGASWKINVLADAQEAGLMTDLATVNFDVPMTREQAAQLMWNALNATMVKTTITANGTTITTGDGTTITTGSSATVNPIDWTEQYTTPNDDQQFDATNTKLQLVEKYFPTLTKRTVQDSLGRDVNLLYIDADKSNSQGTAEASINATTVAAKYTLLGNAANTGKTVAEALIKAGYYKDADAVGDATGYNHSIAAGEVVEVYTNPADGKLAKIINYSYDLKTVKSIVKAASTADYKYLVTLTDLDGSNAASYKDTAFTVYDETLAKDDILAVVVKNNKVAIAEDAQVVNGKLTSYATGTITFAGATYPTKNGVGLTDFDNEFNVYLDPNGFVIGSKATTNVVTYNYLYLEKTEVKKATDTLSTSSAATAKAKVTLMDGTTTIVDLPVAQWTGNAAMTTAQGAVAANTINKNDYYLTILGKNYKITDDNQLLNGFDEHSDPVYKTVEQVIASKKFYQFTTDANGAYKIVAFGAPAGTTAKENYTDGVTFKFIAKNAAVDCSDNSFDGTANSKTVLNVINNGKVSTYTGIANFPTVTFEIDPAASVSAGNTAATAVMTLTKNGFLTEINVIGATVVAKDSNWAFYTKPGATTAAGATYTYYVDGVETTYAATSAPSAAGLVDITLTDGKVSANDDSNVVYGTVEAIDDSFVKLAGVNDVVYYATDYKVFDISNEAGGVAGTLKVGDVVAIGKNTDKLEVAYIIDAPVIKGVKVGDSEATTAVTYVQTGASVIVSGRYTANNYLFITFDGTNWVKAINTKIAAIDAPIAYKTGVVTDYAAHAGITYTIDVASMTTTA